MERCVILSTMKRMAWRFAVCAMKCVAYGEGVILLLFLGPVIVVISVVEILMGLFIGWRPVSRQKYDRDMLKAFQEGYDKGLRHMASPPHLRISARPRLWKDVAEILRNKERR